MIYLFSGLGADSRVFESLDLGDQPTQVIEWRQPLPSETLAQYARRLVQEQIDVKPDAVLIGVSFGGMVAVEVARMVKPANVILISSAKSFREIPWYYRWIGNLRLDAWIPARLLTVPNLVTYQVFGVSSQKDRQLLKNILQTTDRGFLKWAIRQILSWQTLHKIENLVHIHGDNDHLLPHRYIKNAILIKNGGHLMIVTQVNEISETIRRILE